MNSKLADLARNLIDWPDLKKDYKALLNSAIKSSQLNGDVAVLINNFTREEWQAAREELQNKPPASAWPEWANCMAQMSDGNWLFYYRKPTANINDRWNVSAGKYIFSGYKGEVLGDGIDMLVAREDVPELNKPDWSIAPVGTTHYGHSSKDYKKGWYRQISTEYWSRYMDDSFWCEPMQMPEDRIEMLIPKPELNKEQEQQYQPALSFGMVLHALADTGGKSPLAGAIICKRCMRRRNEAKSKAEEALKTVAGHQEGAKECGCIVCSRRKVLKANLEAWGIEMPIGCGAKPGCDCIACTGDESHLANTPDLEDVPLPSGMFVPDAMEYAHGITTKLKRLIATPDVVRALNDLRGPVNHSAVATGPFVFVFSKEYSDLPMTYIGGCHDHSNHMIVKRGNSGNCCIDTGAISVPATIFVNDKTLSSIANQIRLNETSDKAGSEETGDFDGFIPDQLFDDETNALREMGMSDGHIIALTCPEWPPVSPLCKAAHLSSESMLSGGVLKQVPGEMTIETIHGETLTEEEFYSIRYNFKRARKLAKSKKSATRAEKDNQSGNAQ